MEAAAEGAAMVVVGVVVVGMVQAHCAALSVRCREAVTLGSSCNAGVGVEEGEGSTRVITPPSPNTLPGLLLLRAVGGGYGKEVCHCHHQGCSATTGGHSGTVAGGVLQPPTLPLDALHCLRGVKVAGG